MAVNLDVSLPRVAQQRHFIGPVADVLLLGGGSVIALALVALIWPEGSETTGLATTMLLIAHAINHPHFAHSYQLFYRDFGKRAFGDAFPQHLRRRYVFAGVVAPLLLIGWFALCVSSQNTLALGLGVNLMGFLVGWHYVKQGYGLLIVDSVLKRNFFDQRGKNLLLLNAYAIWILSWLQVNRIISQKQYWGIDTYTFAIPDWLFYASIAIAACTTVMAIKVLAGKLLRPQAGGDRPIAGVVAYATSLYVWIVATRPALWLVIPAFHSLQYLVVVWKYRLNMERQNASTFARLLPGRGAWTRFALFCLFGMVLGYFGFWGVPDWLDDHVPYDRSAFGMTLFIFCFWIFINVHHYCLDNVMWRKDNPDTKRHLFGG